jgi:agmatine/peptidylarginine deiminase
MLTWPHADTDWAEALRRVLPVFAEIGTHISARERLLSVCRSASDADTVRRALLDRGARTSHLCFAIADSNDTWARDHGPLTTLCGDRAILNDFDFNGWGGRFDAALDSQITAELHALGAFGTVERRATDLVLEGGAIETDGDGTLLATRHSIVSESRNPGLTQHEIEQRLTEQLGLERLLWLEHGAISGDDTDGHIDTLARFADRETILYATAPTGDADHEALSAMADELRAMRTASGRPYALQALPFPGVHRDHDGRRLPATYANFLLINDAVLLPTYGVAQDAEARDVLQSAFPRRAIIGIDCREIIRQNGSLHCLTMQFPAPVGLNDTLAHTAA